MNKGPFAHLLLGSFLAFGVSTTAWSAETGEAAAGETTNDEAVEDEVSLFSGTFEYGLGHVSDDSFRFGRYTGLEDEGPYAIAGFDVHFAVGRPDYLHLQGENLGLDSRWLSFEYGKQGHYETRLEYRELPNFTIETAETPYTGVGTDTLKRPPGGSLNDLRPLELETKRKSLSGGVSYFLRKDVKASFDIRRTEKEGTDWIGGALLAPSPGGGGGFGRSYAAILPEPVDYSTTEIDAGVDYNGERSQFRVSLHASLFENDYARLRWDDPGFSVSGSGSLPPLGQLALPPDNQFYQLSLSGATRVTDSTRLTGALSWGVMRQDENFLPYGLSGAADPLPRDSLDGEVYVTSARIGITSRPIKPLRLKAQYAYDERDNETPSAAYDYDRLDSGSLFSDVGGPGAPDSVKNEPLSYRKHKASLGATYRLTPDWTASAEYEYRHTDRDNSDVEKSREHTGKLGLKWRIRDDLESTLRVSESSREADEYDAELDDQNPLLRKYYLADRDRTKGGLLVSYSPTEDLSIGIGADLTDDDYSDSAVGLTEAESSSYNLDISYVPTADVRLHAFYTYDRIESRQVGDPGGALSLYRVDFDDRIDTLGLGGEVDNLWGRWNLGLTYRYSKGEGDIEHADLDGGGAVGYPTLKNALHSIELRAGYDLNKKTRLKIAAIYEQLDAEDWAVDDVPTLLNDGRVLTLGNDSEDYDVFAFLVAIQHRF